mmetsp:Transcript_48955/g.136552  ORF Transcript_48955/g.136552 Transcript_48955/m.136552 type:complete len:215 (-) Transcript_48955:695-1339(-)
MGRCPQEWQGRERHGRLQGVRLHRRRAELGLGCVQEGGETGEVRRGLLLRPGGYEGQAALRFQRLLHDDARRLREGGRLHLLLRRGVGPEGPPVGRLSRQGAGADGPGRCAEGLPARRGAGGLGGARAAVRPEHGRELLPRQCVPVRGARRADELAWVQGGEGRVRQGAAGRRREAQDHQGLDPRPAGAVRAEAVSRHEVHLGHARGHGRAGVH